MYAIVRKNSYDPAKLARATGALAEFRKRHAVQTAHMASIEVDLGGGEHLVVNLWQTESDARAGMAVLVRHVKRLLEPLMTGPSQLLGAGDVTASDLAQQ
jgi:hypothetical protein